MTNVYVQALSTAALFTDVQAGKQEGVNIRRPFSCISAETPTRNFVITGSVAYANHRTGSAAVAV